mgnify:CR=1 FL=1
MQLLTYSINFNENEKIYRTSWRKKIRKNHPSNKEEVKISLCMLLAPTNAVHKKKYGNPTIKYTKPMIRQDNNVIKTAHL